MSTHTNENSPAMPPYDSAHIGLTAREYAKDLTNKYLEASGLLQRQLAEAREENARLREIAVLCRNVLNDLHQLPTAKQYRDTPCLSREYATAVRISLIKLNQALTL